MRRMRDIRFREDQMERRYASHIAALNEYVDVRIPAIVNTQIGIVNARIGDRERSGATLGVQSLS